MTEAIDYDLDLEEAYDKIYIKVAGQGEKTTITGISVGTESTDSLFVEWNPHVGQWLAPICIDRNE